MNGVGKRKGSSSPGRQGDGNSGRLGSFPVTVNPTHRRYLRPTGPSGPQGLPALSPHPRRTSRTLTSQAAPWLPSRLDICSYQALAGRRGGFNSRPNLDPSSPPPATSAPMTAGHPCASAGVLSGVLTPSPAGALPLPVRRSRVGAGLLRFRHNGGFCADSDIHNSGRNTPSHSF